MIPKPIFFTITITVAVFTSNQETAAQSLWTPQKAGKSVTLEVLKPDFQDEDEFTFLTSAYFLSLNFPLSEDIVLKGELPFAHAADENRSQSTLGNPYFGLELRRGASSFFAEVGLRLPLAQENNLGGAIGLLSHLDRGEAFADNRLPVLALMNYRLQNKSNWSARLRFGPAFLITTEGRVGSDVNFLYSAQLGYDWQRVSLLTGLTGRWNVSDGVDDFRRDANHQLGFAVHFKVRTLRPGGYVRIPIDETLDEVLDYVVGLQMSVGLPD